MSEAEKPAVEEREVGIAVVGAGPAGLAAALSARRLGAEVLLIDEYAKAGGQYHRQPAGPGPSAVGAGIASQAEDGRRLFRAAVDAGVEFRSNAVVWGAFAPRRLCVDMDGESVTVHAKRIVIATGAHDRTLPFPGWTLPGVITPGAAQTLLKAHGLLAGERIVVAGTGPFLLVVARDLARAGARVDLIESARPGLATFFGFLRFPRRWGELIGLVRELRSLDVRIHLGQAVVRALPGQGGRLDEVITQSVDDDGGLIPGAQRRLQAEVLAIAHGFRAQAELGRLLGARHDYDERRGGAFLRIDRSTGETTADGVHAAGECTGIAGSQVAREAGRVAGLSAARALGFWDRRAERELAAVRRTLARHQRFADLVSRTFVVPAALADLAAPTTVVCRCEGVSRREIDAAIDAGARTTSAVKRWTRSGMGQCQGRICNWAVARLVAGRCSAGLAEADNFVPRIPVKPVALSRIVGRPADRE